MVCITFVASRHEIKGGWDIGATGSSITVSTSSLQGHVQESSDSEKNRTPHCLTFCLAYQKVPQASTGFSPFKLIYRCHIKGRLDILKKNLETGKCSSENMVSYELAVQEKLASMAKVEKENLSRVTTVQKEWYMV